MISILDWFIDARLLSPNQNVYTFGELCNKVIPFYKEKSKKFLDKFKKSLLDHDFIKVIDKYYHIDWDYDLSVREIEEIKEKQLDKGVVIDDEYDVIQKHNDSNMNVDDFLEWIMICIKDIDTSTKNNKRWINEDTRILKISYDNDIVDGGEYYATVLTLNQRTPRCVKRYHQKSIFIYNQQLCNDYKQYKDTNFWYRSTF